MNEIHIAWVLVALLAGLFVGFGVSGWIGYRWVHPKPAKVVHQPAPVTVISKPDTNTKPQPVVSA